MSKEFYSAEIGALRSELNSVIDRMNGNENFSAVTISAIFAFILSTTILLTILVLAFIYLIIVFIGVKRYSELRSHAHKLDDHLEKIEREFLPNGGWTAHYYATIKDSSLGGHSATRYMFWFALGIVCLLGTVYVAYSLIGDTTP